MELAEKLELHYFLEKDSHSMDALVRNKCEAEALAMFKEIAAILGIQVILESVAHQEGGLKETWQFIGKNKDQLTLLLAIVVLVFSRFPASNPDQDKLTKELTKLSIEEKVLSIEKLKRESKAGEVHKDSIESASAAIDANLKVAVRKSNFYKYLVCYKKVTGVGFTPLSKDSVPVDKEKYIDRPDFNKFIMLTDKLPLVVIEDAKIEIVSPVLREGNYQWKGIYKSVPINFAMLDEEFKISVLREEISFQHGSGIECVLNIHRKFDEVGDIVITGYSVATVIKKTDGGSEFETNQGKRHLDRQKVIKSQMSLFQTSNK